MSKPVLVRNVQKLGVENVNVGIIKSQCGFESGFIIENHVVMS